LPLASRWYPREYQGLALGIAGAGNSGTALATFFAPRLAEILGWQAILGLALIPLLATFVLFVVFAKDSPSQPPRQRITDYTTVLTKSDTWWFCLFYSVTFGGFVGLASFLNIYFHDQYGLNKAQAGAFATICVIAGSFLRPLGGFLSDRFGGVRMLTLLFVIIGNCLIALATTPALAWGTMLMLTTMGMLGLGNGAVFQLVPLRFEKEIGTVTGIVGAAGGIGGFFLPTLLGSVKQLSGSFGGGFLLFGVFAFAGAAGLIYASRTWEGIFSFSGQTSSTINNESLVSGGAIEGNY
jgi:NNP family nitrate/nitrite transporter-like MFS transporter